MQYYSTERKSENVSFKEAILEGLAPDRGLYMPESFGKIDPAILKIDNFQTLTFEVAKLLIDNEIPDADLKQITDDAFDFEVPLNNINNNIYSLELFHGPTAAFKDFGARFMARTMSYFLKKSDRKVTILVATSGDTGSAVAKGFYNVPNIDVVILYPKGKVSFLQEKQLTTLGGNITALEVRGNFDDCQTMVKDAFTDSALKKQLGLSSANSINVGRLLPQSFYYYWAYNRLQSDEVIFCTPSGNFGNITAGLIAKRMGLPVKHFVAATNVNDVVPEYLETGIFKPRPSVATYSNAMDVGNPSNFDRMLELYGSKEKMLEDITGYSVTDEETVETIKRVYDSYGYTLDPHGAVGYKAIEEYIKSSGDSKTPIVLLETAHPAKFGDVMKKALGKDVEIPAVLQDALNKEKKATEIDASYDKLKEYLLSR